MKKYTLLTIIILLVSLLSTVNAGKSEWIEFELDRNNSKITLIDSPTIEYSYTLSVFTTNIVGRLKVHAISSKMLISVGYNSNYGIEVGKLYYDEDSSAVLLELNLQPLGNIDGNETVEIYAKGEYQFSRGLIHHPIIIGHATGQDLSDLIILLGGTFLVLLTFSFIFLKYIKVGKILKFVRR